MIENANVSKNPVNGEFVDIQKYIGVASVNVLAVNPDNATLRKYGWTVAEDAQEPNYVTIKEDGKKLTRVRFLAQIHDLEEKPVVAIDFWVSPEICINSEGSKCKILDSFGRTAWGTKDEVKAKKIPQYSSGPANISTPYKPCHRGEEELVNFLFKYLNITPLQMYDRVKKNWVPSKNPGRLTIDNWGSLCEGNVEEIRRYVNMQPDNRVKVILGVRSTDDNKTYQTFLNTLYIGNGAVPDRNTGEYTNARKAIDKFYEGRPDSPYNFIAAPVKVYSESATQVSDNSGTMFDGEGNYALDPDDLPFD